MTISSAIVLVCEDGEWRSLPILTAPTLRVDSLEGAMRVEMTGFANQEEALQWAAR